eukprot:jgi/Mesen1/10594/ME000852S09899
MGIFSGPKAVPERELHAFKARSSVEPAGFVHQGPQAPVGNGKAKPLQRTWSGSECSHTTNIFEKPYASIKDMYEVGPVLGSGQFGCVRSCTHRVSREKFAVKVICKSSLKTATAVEVVREEVIFMQAVGDHPSVIALRDIVEDSKYVCLVLELCPGGDLFDRITERKHYPENEAAEVVASIAEVLRHCRSRGVLHRDLKPENILLCNKSSHTKIRVADFGSAAFVQPGQKLSSLAGSPLYVAPEVINGSYGLEADVWSTGVILYILLCGTPPFWGKDDNATMASIKAGKVNMSWGPWLQVSEEAKDLVRRMLTLDPAQRITLEEILEHSWINKYVMPVLRPLLTTHRRTRSAIMASPPSSPLGGSSPRRASPLSSVNNCPRSPRSPFSLSPSPSPNCPRSPRSPRSAGGIFDRIVQPCLAAKVKSMRAFVQ